MGKNAFLMLSWSLARLCTAGALTPSAPKAARAPAQGWGPTPIRSVAQASQVSCRYGLYRGQRVVRTWPGGSSSSGRGRVVVVAGATEQTGEPSTFGTETPQQEQQQQQQLVSVASCPEGEGSGRPVVSFPGGGIYFWYQAGVITALNDYYDLSEVDFVGGSAGALSASLAACGADMDKAMDLALALCDENGVWDRPLGLGGVWGGMVRSWLRDLLPDDAHSICKDRVHLLVMRVRLWPPPYRRLVTDFESKDDLIDALMASVHVPYFMNKRFSARYRGKRYLDGSFRASREKLSLGLGQRHTAWFHHTADPQVDTKEMGGFLALTTREGLLQMRGKGYAYVERLRREGQLDFLPQREGRGGGNGEGSSTRRSVEGGEKEEDQAAAAGAVGDAAAR